MRLFSAFGLALLAVPSAVAIEANARTAALESVTADEVKQHVAVLADDTFEGREAGTRGNRAAGIYIVERLQKLGIAPGGPNGSYYQPGNGANNILGFIEGRDPELKQEVILVGAHYDHVGYGTNRNSYGPTGYIHNGADDNASGVAGLLEIADAVANLPEKPARSILLAFWDGEEKGLWGSKYWVDHPTVPLDKLRMAMNVDMIGRLRRSRLEVIGIRTAPGLRQLVSRQNGGELLLDFTWDIRGDSDHYPFFSHNIPVLMLHTGKHDDYHRPSDDAEKINHQGLSEIARLMLGIVLEAAEAPELGRFRSQSRVESDFLKGAAERTLAPPPGRLGITWDEPKAAAGEIVVTRVSPNSAADRAGIGVGDRIIAFNGRAVNDPQLLRDQVLAAESDAVIQVQRAGTSQPLDVNLKLAGEPVRLGISWRTDPAEPGAVIINRLVPGSPAARAGIVPGDRIDRINGRSFGSSDEFRELARTLPPPLVFDAERFGRVRTVEIPQLVDTTAGEQNGDESAEQKKLPGPAEEGAADPGNDLKGDASS